MQEITNYEVYLEQMRNGVQDKLFFVDKIFERWEKLVDIGCADGFITAQIKKVFPNKTIVGVDNDPTMLNLAKSTYKDLSVDFVEKIPDDGDIYYMSSILHEIYSYQNPDEISQFWQLIFNSKFKYIVIRDMIYDDNLNIRELSVNEKLALTQFKKNPKIASKLNDFETIWGKIVLYKNFIHFLLKYQYDDNWQREVRENYLPISFAQLLHILPSNVKISYLDHRTLPYFSHKWKKDLGVTIDEKIHCKIILEKH